MNSFQQRGTLGAFNLRRGINSHALGTTAPPRIVIYRTVQIFASFAFIVLGQTYVPAAENEAAVRSTAFLNAISPAATTDAAARIAVCIAISRMRGSVRLDSAHIMTVAQKCSGCVSWNKCCRSLHWNLRSDREYRNAAAMPS